MTDYDYRVEFGDCAIETDDREFAEQLICVDGPGPDEAREGGREVPDHAEHITMSPTHVPMQVRIGDGPDVDAAQLEELREEWCREASRFGYNTEARMAYCDAAEKLRRVLDGKPWAKSP